MRVKICPNPLCCLLTNHSLDHCVVPEMPNAPDPIRRFKPTRDDRVFMKVNRIKVDEDDI